MIEGFSKLSKEDKINHVLNFIEDPVESAQIIKSFWHQDNNIQQLIDEFSENTISNFYFPLSIAPNFLINGELYLIPMVIEESSVVAAASKGAKFWINNGGFHAEVISATKIGQVHFIWNGNPKKLYSVFPELKKELFKGTASITKNMILRGGGIESIELIDLTDKIAGYYQLKAKFDTVDSMGANFINSCLEEFATTLKAFCEDKGDFNEDEKDCDIIMSILSNYTPDCLVKSEVECDIADLKAIDESMGPEKFAWKFEKAVQIAKTDEYRATTHNKGIFNGVDAVAIATGNDFRAIEACGHTYASRSGKYASLSDIEVSSKKFRYSLTLPMALGTVGGLTSLHPMAKFSLELLGNPSAKQLMKIAASVGLANNFGALKSLVTKGIQVGHMKMHLLNILNLLEANQDEKEIIVSYFQDKKVSVSEAKEVLTNIRENKFNYTLGQ